MLDKCLRCAIIIVKEVKDESNFYKQRKKDAKRDD